MQLVHVSRQLMELEQKCLLLCQQGQVNAKYQVPQIKDQVRLVLSSLVHQVATQRLVLTEFQIKHQPDIRLVDKVHQWNSKRNPCLLKFFNHKQPNTLNLNHKQRLSVRITRLQLLLLNLNLEKMISQTSMQPSLHRSWKKMKIDQQLRKCKVRCTREELEVAVDLTPRMHIIQPILNPIIKLPKQSD